MFLLEDETQKIENNYENLLKKGMKILSKIENSKLSEENTKQWIRIYLFGEKFE